jgi:hypothetical protein
VRKGDRPIANAPGAVRTARRQHLGHALHRRRVRHLTVKSNLTGYPTHTRPLVPAVKKNAAKKISSRHQSKGPESPINKEHDDRHTSAFSSTSRVNTNRTHHTATRFKKINPRRMKTPNILSHDTMDIESITKANRDSLALINRHPAEMKKGIKKACRPVCSKCHLAIPFLTWHQPPKIVPVGHGASMPDGHDAAQPINTRHRMMGYRPAAFRPHTATQLVMPTAGQGSHAPPRHRVCLRPTPAAPCRGRHWPGTYRTWPVGRALRAAMSQRTDVDAGDLPRRSCAPGGRRQNTRRCSGSTTIVTIGHECAIPTLRLTSHREALLFGACRPGQDAPA